MSNITKELDRISTMATLHTGMAYYKSTMKKEYFDCFDALQQLINEHFEETEINFDENGYGTHKCKAREGQFAIVTILDNYCKYCGRKIRKV